MEEWFEANLGLTADELGIVLAFALPLLALLSRRVRAWLVTLSGWAARASGRPQQRYRTWFLAEYGTLRNIYLDREETLSLADSYISLSVQAEGTGSGTQVAAAMLLGEAGPHRIVILGDPGTGKSTLLKAYGAGILRRDTGDSDLNQFGRTGEFPILVTLRQVADFLARGGTLEDHILDVLARRTGDGDPRALFRRLLRHGRIVLLLDGLDEVAEASYDAVAAAVHRFVTAEEDEDLPTAMARVMITCRWQNYRQIKDDWSGWFSAMSYVIAPLRDAEIIRFVDRRASQFTPQRSRAAFLADVRASGTWDMHRVPLVLTISLGLYTQLVGYEIPNSVDDFYDAMVHALLRRHDFKAEGQLRRNRFRANDKHRYLRELALHLAEHRPSPFADFTYADLIDFFAICRRTMPRIQDEHAFISEIIDRSGLLTQTIEGQYAFAHRALHEHLAAAQLVRDPQSGHEFLLARAEDTSWWQVAVQFCGASHRYLEPFLMRLADEHLRLACQCLAMAEVSADVAKVLIDRARAYVLVGQEPHLMLPAIVEAVKSPIEATRDLAFDALVQGLLWTAHHTDRDYQRQIITALFGGQSPVAGKVLLAMSQHATVEMAEAVNLLTSTMPDDDPSLVAPLWHCLSIPGVARSHRVVVRDIVERLIVLAMNEECAAVLDRLPPADPAWSTAEDRAIAYPLKKGLPPDANLVTLLGMGRALRILERFPRKNLYLEALTVPGRPLALIETAPFWSRTNPARWAEILAWGASGSATVATLALTIMAATGALNRPPTNAFVAAGVGAALFHLVAFSIIRRAVRHYLDDTYGHPPTWWRYLVPAPVPAGLPGLGPLWLAMAAGRPARWVYYAQAASALPWYLTTLVVFSVPIVVLLEPLPWLIPIVLVPLLLVFVWLPSTELCGAFTTRLLLSSRSYMTVYSDRESRHWVLPRAAAQAATGV